MEKVSFKKGPLAKLPAEKTAGTLYMTTDERAIYLDVSESERVRFGDFQEFEDVAALGKNNNPSTTALYYVKDINCLAKWDGEQYIQINLDTGATHVATEGDGNVVTSITYDEGSRTLTLHKDGTYATTENVDTAISTKVGAIDEATVKEYVDKKTQSISGDEESIQDLQTRMTAAEGSIKTVTGEEETEGSIKYALKEAKDYTDTAKSDLDGKITTANGQISALEADVAELQGKDTTHDTKIAALEEQIKGVSGAMHFKGKASQDPAGITEGYVNGDVVIWGEKEYVWVDTAFVELGDVSEVGERLTALEGKAHEHSNKTELDQIKIGDVTKWNGAQAAAEATAAAALEQAKTELSGQIANGDSAMLSDAKSYTDTALTWGEF